MQGLGGSPAQQGATGLTAGMDGAGAGSFDQRSCNPFMGWAPYGSFPGAGFSGCCGCSGGAFPGSAKGGGSAGKGKGDHYFKGSPGYKGKGGGKGKGKVFGSEKGKFGGSGGELVDFAGDPRRQIELAQRRAKQRDRCAITQAQRNAQQRFEKDLLDRVQGTWIDESDPTSSYVVEGSICSVSGGDNARVFRNRISVYGGELCWDAKRFWHYLDLKSLPAEGPVDKVLWTPGEGSPPTRPITWLRGTPAPAAELEEQQNDSAP